MKIICHITEELPLKEPNIRMISFTLLSLVLLATTSDAQLSSIPTKLMRSRIVGGIEIKNQNRKVLGRRPPSSSHHRRMKRDVRQFMSMDTDTITQDTTTTQSSAVTQTETFSSTTTSTTTTTKTTTTASMTSSTKKTDISSNKPETSPPTPSEAITIAATAAATLTSTTSSIMTNSPSSSPTLSISSTTASPSIAVTKPPTPLPTPTDASTYEYDIITTDDDSTAATNLTISPTPSSAATGRHGPIKMAGLTLYLFGVKSIPNQSKWESITSKYFTNVYNSNNDDEASLGVDNAKVQISITNIDTLMPESVSKGAQRAKQRRGLKESTNGKDDTMLSTNDVSVKISYTQIMWYTNRTTTATATATTTTTTENSMEDTPSSLLLFQLPLSTDAYRDEYVGQLKYASDGYEDLTAVSAISVSSGVQEENANYATAKESGNLSVGVVIAMAAGMAALLTMLAMIIYMNCGEYRSKDGNTLTEEVMEDGTNIESNGIYRYSTTTGGRTIDGNGSTVDYDYHQPGAYNAGMGRGGGGGGVSGLTYVSDAGGTLGSRRSHLTGAELHEDDDRYSIVMGEQTIFSDDPTYVQREDVTVREDVTAREEMFEVYAPPGKLGVVIDNPDGRNPIIHAVKDTSPIAPQVCIGDRVVAVDDEDVRGMSAMKVSRLISRKSKNATRKLTIIRRISC